MWWTGKRCVRPNYSNAYLTTIPVHAKCGARSRSFNFRWVKTDSWPQELIKYKGLPVAPAELEALLLSHPLIADAAVIGVPDPDGSGNELPRAYVVADRSKIDEAGIKDFVKSNVARYKQLRGGVIWLDAIPKTASGKILRKDLREMAKTEAGAASLKAKL